MTQVVDRLVVMADRARGMLADIYGIDPRTISCIPHGIPDMGFIDPEVHKDDVGLGGRKVILTYGLMSPNKGVEYMIRAMPAVIRRHPDAMYVVLGGNTPESQGGARRGISPGDSTTWSARWTWRSTSRSAVALPARRNWAGI